jgi:hypothetical protein
VKTNRAFAVAGGVFIVVFGMSASAVEVQRPGGNAAAPTRAKSVPLSAGECKNLGGKTLRDPACTSMIKCTTVDQYGKAHSVCVNEISQ